MLTETEIIEYEFGLVRSLQGGRIDRYSANSLYWHSYEHNIIGLYNGSIWVPIMPPEPVYFNNSDYDINGSSLVGNTNYDVYARYANEDTFQIALVPWSGNTTRSQEPERFEGILVYNTTTPSGKQMRYLGTVRTNGSVNFVDSDTQRFVLNWDNPIMRAVRSYNTSSTDWAMTTSWQEFRAGSNQVRGEFLFIHDGSSYMGMVQSYVNGDGDQGWIGLGLNSTSSYVGKVGTFLASSSTRRSLSVTTYLTPVVGYNYFTIVGKGRATGDILYGGSEYTHGVISVYT